ncbi:MAG: Gfo/Idh/MocA family protein [Puniceicoccales bacterium]
MKNQNSKSSFSGQSIRVGIVGVGNWASYAHIPALNLLPQYRITAVATRQQDTADAFAHAQGIPHAFGNYMDLVRHPEVDLVVVLTIAPQHEAIVRAAIAAGKDVFCEWPLTTTPRQSLELLELAKSAGVRHLIGLQRRLAPSFRYMRDLLDDGYAGKIRSVRLCVSEPDYYVRRSKAVAFTIPAENFTHVAVTFGGHFMDAVFTAFGQPRDISARLINQFKEVTLIETGEVIATDAPNELLMHGILGEDTALSIHVEGGKRNGYGMELTITGTDGDLKLSNQAAFHNESDNRVWGAQGAGHTLRELPVPAAYDWLPASDLPSSALEMANLYAAHAMDLTEGTNQAPTFKDAVRLHQLLDTIAEDSLHRSKKRGV